MEYMAAAVIGYRLKIQTVSTPISNCGHTYPEGSNYCPACGLKAGTHLIQENPEGWDDFDEEFETNIPAGYVYHQNGDVFWFGYGVCCAHDEGDRIPAISYDEIKSDIMRILRPYFHKSLFTFDQDSFAVWALNIRF